MEILEPIRSGNFPIEYWGIGIAALLILLFVFVKITKFLFKLAIGLTIVVSLAGLAWWFFLKTA